MGHMVPGPKRRQKGMARNQERKEKKRLLRRVFPLIHTAIMKKKIRKIVPHADVREIQPEGYGSIEEKF